MTESYSISQNDAAKLLEVVKTSLQGSSSPQECAASLGLSPEAVAGFLQYMQQLIGLELQKGQP